MAVLQGDKLRVRDLETEFRKKARSARLQDKDKVEDKFIGWNAKDTWKGLNVMMGRKQQQQGIQCGHPLAFANGLNACYARVDVTNFKNECEDLCKTILPSPVNVDDREVCLFVCTHCCPNGNVPMVVTCLSRVNPRKAPGPDGLGTRI